MIVTDVAQRGRAGRPPWGWKVKKHHIPGVGPEQNRSDRWPEGLKSAEQKSFWGVAARLESKKLVGRVGRELNPQVIMKITNKRQR